jgi:hypothetical protein
MSRFEFFMSFYGLLLGLGVAELLGGFANLLRERQAPRPGIITPLVGLLAFTEMLANFVDAWNRLQQVEINLVPLLVPTLIGVAYYLVAVILLPRDLSEWPSLDAYFDRRKRWIVGLLLGINLLIIVTTTPAAVLRAVFALPWTPAIAGFVLCNLWLLGAYTVLLLARRRVLEIAAAALALLFYPTFYWLVDLHLFN